MCWGQIQEEETLLMGYIYSVDRQTSSFLQYVGLRVPRLCRVNNPFCSRIKKNYLVPLIQTIMLSETI